VPRPEHPRPDRVRADWHTLNGAWEFDFDEADRGLAEGWFRGTRGLSRTIVVPYCPESRLSGIGDTSPYEVVWYRRQIAVPEGWRSRRVWLNGARKLGFIAWGEMANAYEYSDIYVSRMLEEWPQAVARDYNHPSIIAWVPINESWGVPAVLTDRAQQAHLKTRYHLTRSLDATRLVVDNDGWEHTDATDLMTLHDYARTGAELAAKYQGVGEPGRPPTSAVTRASSRRWRRSSPGWRAW
jgi:beta-galactosidase/beta-glucuronidase